MLMSLDLGGKVGWALFHPDGRVAQIGTFKVPKGAFVQDYGSRALHLARWLYRFIRDRSVTRLVYESPFLPLNQFAKKGVGGATFTQHGIRLGVVWTTTAELIAAQAGIECAEVAVVSAKVELSGDHRAKKPAMIAAARARGWPVEDEHQADALGVGLVDLVARGILPGRPPKPKVPKPRRARSAPLIEFA